MKFRKTAKYDRIKQGETKVTRKMPEYILSQTERTICADCSIPVKMLAPKTESMSLWPAFYICPRCGFVGQVGVGPVETEE